MADNLNVQILGLTPLFNKLDRAVRQDVISGGLREGALYLAGWVKKNRLSGARPKYLGVVSGRLRSSIAASRVIKTGEEYSAKIGTNVVYGAIHEFGGYAGRNHKVFIRPRPFLRPAIEEAENKIAVVQTIVKRINQALEAK